MRILIANSSYIADHGGGEKKGLLEQAKCFRDLGHEVDILTLDVIEDALGEFRNFRIIKAGVSKDTYLPLKHVLAIYKYLTIHLDGYNQIWANDFPAIILALRHRNVNTFTFGPNHLLSLRKEYYLNKLPLLLRPLGMIYIYLLTKLDKFLMKRVKIIVAISNSVKKKTEEYYGRSDIRVIPLGVHNPRESITPSFKKFIFCPSRLIAAKRIDRIVKSMEYLPEYELYIAGEGNEKKNLQRIVKENNLRVKFLDFMPLKRLERYYLTCFCVVYIPINEDFGMVPIEAQSYGKMVIGAKEGGLLETIIDGKTGLLIENPTSKKIAEKVRGLERMNLEEHAKFCIENARKFDWEVFHKKFDELMGELDKKERKRPLSLN